MKKDLLYNNQQALFGSREIVGFGSEDWHVKETERNLANKIIVENHYSKKFYNATYIHLGVFIGGGITWGFTVWLCYEPRKLW